MRQDPPAPYNPARLNRFWKDEPWDKLVPPGGFIQDFVLANRGIESPTKFAVWTGVFIVSSTIKRAAWLDWASKMYPNFYIIMVAPPRLNPKTEISARAERLLLDGYQKYLPPRLAVEKRTSMMLSRCTPESISLVLEASENEAWYNEATKTYEKVKGAEVLFLIEELSDFLGKQKYNEGLVSRLTSLYNCKDVHTDMTIARGLKVYHNVFVNLLGGTTRDGLTSSLTVDAFGSGFMSRVIIVYQYMPTRMFVVPIRQIPGLPPIEDQMKRLAWVAENAVGEYTLSPEALEFYSDWYPKFKQRLIRDGEFEKRGAGWSRLDIHMLKLGMVLRAQRYEPGTIIAASDLQLANQILEETVQDAGVALQDVGVSAYQKNLNHLKDYIRNGPSHSRTRAEVQPRMSRYGVDKEELRVMLMDLLQEGLTIELDGINQASPSSNGKEVYKWPGPAS